MNFKINFLPVLAAAFLLPACATDRTFGASPDIEITDLETLPAPTDHIGYTIGPREKLEIQVVGSEELSGPFLTDDTGNIFFPFIDKVQTGGKSADEAARMIADGLRGRYLLNPQVRVIPEELTPPSISIGGQVEKPGSYPVSNQPTLLRLINDAEGLGEYAKHDDVLVMREVDGQDYIGLFNVQAIERGNYPDPVLYAGDIVMVGDSPARRRLDNILQFAPLLTSSAIVIDRLGN